MIFGDDGFKNRLTWSLKVKGGGTGLKIFFGHQI